MAVRLQDSLFDSYSWLSGSLPRYSSRGVHPKRMSPLKYLKVPLGKIPFELPLLTLDSLRGIINSIDDGVNNVLNTDSLIVPLEVNNIRTYYKSLERNLVDVLGMSTTSGLYKIVIDEKNGVFYYATRGAIFDRELNPIMICSWKVASKEFLWEGRIKQQLEFTRPVLRIDANCFTSQKNAMERLVSKKIPSLVLPRFMKNPFSSGECANTPEVIIEDFHSSKFPFKIREVFPPSMSVRDKEFFDVVKDYKEELVCL